MHGLSSFPGRVALALVLPALLAVPAHAQQSQRFALSGQRVEIYNVAGNVSFRRGMGSEVVVQATRVGSDAAELQFATDEGGSRGAARFRVVYPLDQLNGGILFETGGSTELRLRADGTFGGDSEGSYFTRRGNHVDISRDGDFRGYADLTIAVPAGKEVVLHLAVGQADLTGVDGDFTIDTWGADVVAENISGTYLFDTGSGDVEVRGGTGTIRIDTGSGSGTVSAIRGDLLEIDTGSGNAIASDVQVDRARFDTGSGEVRVRDVQAGNGEADTGSGDVELQFTGGDIDDWTIDTGSGSATVTLPPQASARITISTGSGDIDVTRQNVVMERRQHDEMVLRVGSGTGRVHIDTGSGDVTIR